MVSDAYNIIALAFQTGLTSNFNVSTYGIMGDLTIIQDQNITNSTNPYPTFSLKLTFIAYILPFSGVIILYKKIIKRKKSMKD